jgi:WD40 repeat protein
MNSNFTAHRCALVGAAALLFAAPPARAQYPAAVLADKPAAYYRFDEMSGTTVGNASPTGAIEDGIITTSNGAAVTLGQAGALAGDRNTAFLFGGDYVVIPRPVQDDFTIEFFFNTTSPGFGDGLGQFWTGSGLVSGDQPGPKDDFGTAFSGGRVVFGVGNALPGTSSFRDISIRSQAGLNDGKYHLVDAVRVRSTGNIQLYIDGNLVTSATGGTQSLNALPYLHVGHIPSFGAYPKTQSPFIGSIDEVSLYPAALSADRIKQHYLAATTPAPAAPPPSGVFVAPYKKLSGHSEYVNSVAFSPDGRTLASGSRDKSLRLWNVQTGEQRILGKHDAFVSCVAFSPDGRTLVSGGWDNRIRQFDVASGDEISERKFDKHGNYVLSLAFSPNGRRLVSGSNDKTARSFSVATGESLVTSVLPEAVASVAYSPDSSRVAGACLDGSVYIWDAASLQLVRRISADTGAALAVVFLDNDTVAVGGKSGVVRIFAVRAGTAVATITAGKREIYGLAFSAKRGLLAAGGTDKLIRVWTLHAIRQAHGGNVAPAASIAGHRDTVRTVAFDPSGSLLASGSWDYDILIDRVAETPLRDTLLIDDLDDFSKTASHTAGLVLERYRPEFSDNTTARLKRVADTPESVTYHVTDLKDFTARIYFAGDFGEKVRVFGSSDNQNWSPVAFTHDEPVTNSPNWFRTILRPTGLPAGTNYLKIELANDPAIYSPELSEVRLVSPGRGDAP